MQNSNNERKEDLLDRIIKKLNSISAPLKNEFHPKKSFSYEIHPRRKQLYKPFIVKSSTFFKLKANGVPVLTSYFLCDTNNMIQLYKQIEQQNSFKKNNALYILKNI
jgi:hypothetical protein